MARLDDQVRKSIQTTMHGLKPAESQVAELTAYLRSLETPPPSRSGAAEDDGSAVMRGRQIFQARKCATCHIPPEYTSPEQYDVGLADELGVRRFNPPSLRGVSQRDALLHDGRARSLEEVIEKSRHPGGTELPHSEVADLVAFLKTL
jgi:cytochrome c peroxidase